MAALGPSTGGNSTALGLTTSTVLSTGPALLYSFNVTTAGAAGSLHDCTTTAAAAAGNLIAVTPATVGIYPFAGGWPCAMGLVYIPSTSQVASISFTPFNSNWAAGILGS